MSENIRVILQAPLLRKPMAMEVALQSHLRELNLDVTFAQAGGAMANGKRAIRLRHIVPRQITSGIDDADLS